MPIPFPGFDRLFKLSDPLSDRVYRGEFCHPQSIELVRAELAVRQPVLVNWAMGRKRPTDVVWTTSAHPLLIGDRVRQLLVDEFLTGWSTYPVRVRDKHGQLCDGYHGLSITGRCGAEDINLSKLALKEYPAGWFPQFVGHFFKPDSWDGSDLFMHESDCRNRASLCIHETEAVRSALTRAKVKNVMYEALSEVSVSTAIYGIGCNYLLPADFGDHVKLAYEAAGVPDPRAR